MNEHDSERIRGVLELNGWNPVSDPEKADLLIYNTCSVRNSAESRLLGRLGEAKRLKNERPERIVALGGCFAQAKKDNLFDELLFLDVAFGPQNIAELPSLINAARSGSGPAGSFDESHLFSGELPARRAKDRRAWIQVMTGCTNFCSYCIVPQVRGPERSRPSRDIVTEVESLVEDGVVEICLLGQNVNAYGREAGAEAGEMTFAGLLEQLDAVKGLERIRFTTSHPKDLGVDLIEAIRDLPAVCEHMHLPAQSGSSKILKRMKRRYSRERYLELVAMLKDKIPSITITTDLIVGFPGEQEEDFFRTMTLVEACRFDGAFTFIFSARSGTEAARLPGTVPEVTVKRRIKELVRLVQEIAEERNRSYVGGEVEVMVEGPSRNGVGLLRGRTRGNKIVNFKIDAGVIEPLAGDLVTVAIEQSTSTTLTGRQLPAR